MKPTSQERDGLNDLLWTYWDPITEGFTEKVPRDEYASYVDGLFQLLRAEASPVEIEAHLREIERDQMDLDAEASRLDAAERVVAWYASRGAGRRGPRG